MRPLSIRKQMHKYYRRTNQNTVVLFRKHHNRVKSRAGGDFRLEPGSVEKMNHSKVGIALLKLHASNRRRFPTSFPIKFAFGTSTTAWTGRDEISRYSRVKNRIAKAARFREQRPAKGNEIFSARAILYFTDGWGRPWRHTPPLVYHYPCLI